VIFNRSILTRVIFLWLLLQLIIPRLVYCFILGIGFGGLWRFAGPFTKVCYKCMLVV